MKRLLRAAGAGAAVLMVLLAVGPASGMLIAPPAIPARVAGADLVVVGKVIAVSDKTIPAERFKGDKGHYQIVTVQTSEILSGHAGKELQVGFVPPPPPPPPPAGGKGPIILPGGRVPPINLTMGAEAVLFLTQHPTKDFYIVNAYYDVINKAGNPSFATTVSDIKRYAKLLANPKPGLESKDKEERFLTAALLISRYRTPRIVPGGAPPKTELVPVAESKLILEALAEADWNAPRPGLMMFTPLQIFYRLGLTPADGWTQPKDFRQVAPEAVKWLKANAGMYRVQRYLRERGGEPAADPAGR